MIQIEPFTPERTEEVGALILAIQQKEFGLAITRADQPDLQAIPDFYQTGAGQFWVALYANAVVGTIGLHDIGGGAAALRKMFVAAPWRGREPGVAQRLLDTLLAWSRARGLHHVYLGTTVKFLAAHRFYEKHGFREIAAAELPASFPAMQVDTKFYAIEPGGGIRA